MFKATHGLRKHPLYKVWAEMRSRCSNPKKDNFKYYGGRGIGICKRWDDFAAFVADMGERPAGTTLDRINPDGDYEPANCRWANKLTQANNTRTNLYLELSGRRMTAAEWSRETGIPVATIYARLSSYGWPVDKALTEPVRDWAPGRKRAYG